MVNLEYYNKMIRAIRFELTASGSAFADATIPPSFLERVQGWFVDQVEVVPGSPAPTANSDLVILDEDGLDILGGSGVNLVSDTTTTGAVPSTGGQNKRTAIRTNLTVRVTGNAVSGAALEVVLVLVREV